MHIDLKHVLSVQYIENVCEICFHTEIVSFGDLSVDPAATLVALVLNNPAPLAQFLRGGCGTRSNRPSWYRLSGVRKDDKGESL